MPSCVSTTAAVGLDVAEQHLVNRYRQLVGVLAKRERQTALRVEVDEQNPSTLLHHRRSQGSNRGGLGHPTLLVGDRQYMSPSRRPSWHVNVASSRPLGPSARIGQNRRSVSVGKHRLVLLRHGETEWSKSGQHTSTTELDLTEEGREQATLAARALQHLSLIDPVVFSSPRKRALHTAELAGLQVDEVTPLLTEWNYGEYEGITTHDIRKTVPAGCCGPTAAPAARPSIRSACGPTRPSNLALENMSDRDVVFVGHGHFSRSIVTRWVEQPLREGARFSLARVLGRVRFRVRLAQTCGRWA